MELILVRHGATQGNLEHRFIGSTDQFLSPEGEEMALRRAKKVPPVEHVFVSPMHRCLRTAVLVWPGVHRTVLTNLRETDFGRYEGKCYEELREDEGYQAWLDAGCEIDLPTAETRAQCMARAGLALESILRISRAEGVERVGVVTHGGTVMAMLSAFAQPRRAYHDWLTPNCGGWRVVTQGSHPVSLQVVGALEEL